MREETQEQMREESRYERRLKNRCERRCEMREETQEQMQEEATKNNNNSNIGIMTLSRRTEVQRIFPEKQRAPIPPSGGGWEQIRPWSQ